MTDARLVDRERRWAADVLGVTSTAEAQERFLRALTEQAYLPEDSQVEALDVLRDQEVGISRNQLSESFRLAYADALNAEIEHFAADFFERPPIVRRRQWQDLRERAKGFSPLALRLELLEAGLSINRDSILTASCGAPDAEHDLDQLLLSTFALPPQARARSRQAFLSQLTGDQIDSLRRVALKVRTDRVALYNLDTELIDYLADRRRRRHRARQVSYRTESSNNILPWLLLALGSLAILSINLDPAPQYPIPSPPRYEPAAELRFRGPWTAIHSSYLATEAQRARVLNSKAKREQFNAWLDAEPTAREKYTELIQVEQRTKQEKAAAERLTELIERRREKSSGE